MRKDSIGAVERKKPRHRQRAKGRTGQRSRSRPAPKLTIGLDLGDKASCYCVLDAAGEVQCERSVATTKKGMTQTFGRIGQSRIALEVGTHSPWVSRLLRELGHEVIVANARRVRAITESSRKDDRMDAQMLARLARVDPGLLCPIRHRGAKAQQHLALIKARAALVEGRTALVNTARGLTKSSGERLASCDTDQMGVQKLEGLPAEMQAALRPVLEVVEELTDKIQGYDSQLAEIARSEYPETALLEQISGVGPLIALTFVLTLEDPERFQRSREVGCYLGLRPQRRDSGESQPQLRITKEGDVYLRMLLVQAAHCILGRRGPDTDLKRWGLKLAARGGKNAKKRAIVAVARKLAVLLHRLWVTGEVYEPLRHSLAPAAKKIAS